MSLPSVQVLAMILSARQVRIYLEIILFLPLIPIKMKNQRWSSYHLRWISLELLGIPEAGIYFRIGI